MRSLYNLIVLFVFFAIVFTSCRPSELEGAFVHYKAQRFDEAFVQAEKATKLYPQNSEAWYLLGVLYENKDNVPEMVKAFDKSLSIDKVKETDIQNTKMSTFAKKFNSGAANFNKFGSHPDPSSDEAIRFMKNAIKDFDDSNLCNPSFSAVLYSAQGYTALEEKDAAQEKFDQLTKTYPDSIQSWIGVGRYYFDEKKYVKASESFQKAVEIDGNSPEAYTLLAHSFDYQDNDNGAMKAYEKAVSLNPTDGGSFFNLGRLYYKLGTTPDADEKVKITNLEKAIEIFGKSIDIDPEYLSSYQLKGNAQLLLKKYDGARITLEKGVSYFPNDKQLWEDLVITYAWLGDKDKAEAARIRSEEL